MEFGLTESVPVLYLLDKRYSIFSHVYCLVKFVITVFENYFMERKKL